MLKRFPYIQKMLAEGKTQERFYIGKRTELITLDHKTRVTVSILYDVENSLHSAWEKMLLQGLETGKTDVQLLHDLPMGREKYYKTKRNLIDKIYKCCIFKGLVSYEDILAEDIG